MAEQIRINVYIRRAGIASRREADLLVASGRVSVERDGERHLAVPGEKVEEDARVYIDGARIGEKEPLRYLIYHKPAGETCTAGRSDKTSILRRIRVPEKVTYAGRLDKDSTGLVFLTNDGMLGESLMRSANGHEKEYLCEVDRPYDKAFVKQMEAGVPILDTVTKPCRVFPVDRTTFRIILTQGLNRQIRRMCGALGYGVRSIHRTRIANLELGDLPEGTYRDLREEELQTLRLVVNQDGK